MFESKSMASSKISLCSKRRATAAEYQVSRGKGIYNYLYICRDIFVHYLL